KFVRRDDLNPVGSDRLVREVLHIERDDCPCASRYRSSKNVTIFRITFQLFEQSIKAVNQTLRSERCAHGFYSPSGGVFRYSHFREISLDLIQNRICPERLVQPGFSQPQERRCEPYRS